MSAVLPDAAQVGWLRGQLAANRFLPAPPEPLMLCGDGDFRAIGAEFLGHFIHLADLRPHERVLDLGCGVGRMAVPLTQYLSEQGSYVGIDIAADGIAWCRRAISPLYPRFRFEHVDLRHPIYNPNGVENAASIRLPFPDASFDFVFLVSVLTHLDTAALTNYAQEIARLLAPGGRCFATAFLMNAPAQDALRCGGGRLPFDPDAPGPEFHADPASPLAAVAFDEDHFLEKFLRFGRWRIRPALYGHWSGRAGPVFQDIGVFE